MAGAGHGTKDGGVPAIKGARRAEPTGAMAPSARVDLRGDLKADDGLSALRERAASMGHGGGRAAEHRRIRNAIQDYRDGQKLAGRGLSKQYMETLGAKYRPLLQGPLGERRIEGRRMMDDAQKRLAVALEVRREAQAKRRPVAAEQGDLFAGMGGSKRGAPIVGMSAESKASWEKSEAKQAKLERLRGQRDERREIRAERRNRAERARKERATETARKAATKPAAQTAPKEAESARIMRQTKQEEATAMDRIGAEYRAGIKARRDNERAVMDEQLAAQRGKPLVTSNKPGKVTIVHRGPDDMYRRQEADSLRAVRGVHLVKSPTAGYTITDQTTGAMLITADSKAHGERLLSAMTKGRTVDRALAPIREGRAPTAAERRSQKAIDRYKRIDIHRSVAKSSASAEKAVATRKAKREAARAERLKQFQAARAA